MCNKCSIGNLYNSKTRMTKSASNGLAANVIGGIGATGVVVGIDKIIDMVSPAGDPLIKLVAPVAVGLLLPIVLPKKLVSNATVKRSLQGTMDIGLYKAAQFYLPELVGGEAAASAGVGSYYMNTNSVAGVESTDATA
jgi:hypothetical protein